MENGRAAIFTEEGVAEYLRADRSTIEMELASGRLSGFKLAGEWRIPASSILSFLSAEPESRQAESPSNARSPIQEGGHAICVAIPNVARPSRIRSSHQGQWVHS